MWGWKYLAIFLLGSEKIPPNHRYRPGRGVWWCRNPRAHRDERLQASGVLLPTVDNTTNVMLLHFFRFHCTCWCGAASRNFLRDLLKKIAGMNCDCLLLCHLWCVWFRLAYSKRSFDWTLQKGKKWKLQKKGVSNIIYGDLFNHWPFLDKADHY